MKKNRMMRLASGLLVAVLLTTCVISGTFAKYVSEAEATDTARVAKWSFNVGSNNDIADATTFTFDLWNHTDGNVDYDGDGTGTEKVIAPGTTGDFDIVLTNNSEVNATYAIEYNVDNQGVPIEYKVGDGAWKTTLDNVAATNIAMNGGTATIKIQWRWAFTGAQSENYTSSQTDITDTDLGKADTLAKPSVTAKITATQVD
ncbi:MAG: hypothetical protein IJP00_03480 [Firmicutes bacterium]|nr:hypothetical protein [Bacillota bacterium]